MKTASLIARVLLALLFIVFGLNFWLKLIPVPPASGQAGAFLGAMFVSGYLAVIKALEVVGGLLVLSRRSLPLGLLVLGPIIININLYDLFLSKGFNPPALLAAVLSLFLLWTERNRFAALVK